MPPHDLLFKELLTTFLDEFLQLFVPGLWENLERDSLHFVEQETPPVADATHMLRGDLVARARMLGEEAAFLVHVEHDAQPRRSGEVVFRYFTAYRERHRCRVYPILLLSYASPRTPREDAYRCQGTPTFPHLGDTYSPAGHWSSWRPQARGETILSRACKEMIEAAIELSRQDSVRKVDSGHLLLAMLTREDEPPALFLAKAGLDFSAVASWLARQRQEGCPQTL